MMDDILGAFLIMLGSVIALFCIAWVTIFPTIGLLYWFGYLS